MGLFFGFPENFKKFLVRFGKLKGAFAYSSKLLNDNYEIILDTKSVDAVKHELYHIYKGNFEDRENLSNGLMKSIKSFFVYEPRAVIYQSLGIKL